MNKQRKIKTVSEYIENAKHWNDEIQHLADSLVNTGLTETIKWGAPCYCLDGRNVVGMMSFSSYFGLWFHRGSQINDHRKVLMNAQEGKTKYLRQWRMYSAEDIDTDLISDYVNQAIHIEKAGPLPAPKRKSSSFEIPVELEQHLALQPDLRTAFAKLTPGRQKEHALYISEAKRADTRARRLDKITPLIRKGVGPNDQYR